MAKFEIISSDNCYVCSEHMGSFKSDLTVQTGYSENAIWQLIESFTNSALSEEVISESGVCQNCFIKFNEYDEHKTLAEQIQFDLFNLMENKLITENEYLQQEDVKLEEESLANDPIEYEPYETEEMFMAAEEVEGEDEEGGEMGESIEETIEEDFRHYEIVVDDTKENGKAKTNRITTIRTKGENNSDEFKFVIVGLDDNHRGYQCGICLKVFKDKSKLKTHREIHTDERNVICSVCGKGFKTQNCLRNHKRLHVPHRTYFNCDQCNKRYTQKVQLKKHIEIIHMLRRDFICTICGASFGTNSVLKMHLLSHSDFRAEKCELCGFRFHTKAKLRRHMKSHTGERNYECSICFKKFLYSYNVIAHIRNVHEKVEKIKKSKVHEGDRLGYCKLCNEGKQFVKTNQLCEHMLQARGDMRESDSVIIEEDILYEYEDDDKHE